MDQSQTSVLRLTEVPEAVLPMTPFERAVSYLTHPFLLYAPAVIAVLVIQAYLPPPRLGVDALWEGSLRFVVGCVALAPSFFLGVPTVIRALRGQEEPQLYATRMAVSAASGATIALVAAWALGASLTASMALLAWLVTVIWIGVTGVVAVFTSLVVRIKLAEVRVQRAEADGVPTSMLATASLTPSSR